jgi:integrase/recombinase XerD
MNDEALLGPWVRRFLLEHVVAERNRVLNTQLGYCDALCQLIPFVAKQSRKPIDRLAVVDISAELVRLFLADLEASRSCGIPTRNQRLAAIRALARFVGEHSPIHIEWSGQIRAIPFKKAMQAVVPYLEKAEIDALLAAPDRRTAQGRRDHILLLFLYNTGARASEVAHVKVADLDLNAASVKICGKGGKQRFCPLWSVTVSALAAIVAGSQPSRPLFLNRCGHPITRFGIHTAIERNALKARALLPTLVAKRVSPHSGIPQRPIFCALALTSTRSELGWGTCRWRPRMSMPRSTLRQKPERWQSARLPAPARPVRTGEISLR